MNKEEIREAYYNAMFYEGLKRGVHKDKELEPYSEIEQDFKEAFDMAFDVASELIRSQIEEKVMKIERRNINKEIYGFMPTIGKFSTTPTNIITDVVELSEVLKAIKEGGK
jgi:hypothetical protein